MKKDMICIVCPKGCRMTICCEKDEILVTGNHCGRGKEYAIAEQKNPVRMVTSTVRLCDGRVASVKTMQPIAKDDIMAVMKMLKKVRIHGPVRLGDIIIQDVFGTQIVATSSVL